ncbi:hypothetical protein FWH13_02265 [Candidatus Saccharibacteria bacterium]|nr:hypothetical protein [Candidatus Saccharibacteria bacterium]
MRGSYGLAGLVLPVLFVMAALMAVGFARYSTMLTLSGGVDFDPRGAPTLHMEGESRNFSIFRGDEEFTPDSLAARVSAVSEAEGDITAAIRRECARGEMTIACPVSWREWGLGSYTITYRVEDSAGRPAQPIVVRVDIWKFINIRNGSRHVAALDSNGAVWTFGWNSEGQRGIGSSVSSAADFAAPTQIPQSAFGDLPVVDVSSAHHTSCAINVAGRAYCWGHNATGAVGDGTNTGRTAPVPVVMPEGVTFRQLSGSQGTAGNGLMGALGSDGNVYTWGQGAGLALGTGATANRNVPTRITETGDIVYAWQGNRGGAAVTESGEVYVWGANGDGQLAMGNTTAANATTSRPRLVNGLPAISRVAYGGYGTNGFVVALAVDGTVWGWGRAWGLRGVAGSQTTPVRIEGVSDVRQINAGADFTHMVVGDELYSVGYNNYGELLLGDTSTRREPTLSGLENIAGNVGMVTGGYDNAYALSRDGTMVFGVGFSNAVGQSFGSTEVWTTTTNRAVGWTIRAPMVEW